MESRERPSAVAVLDVVTAKSIATLTSACSYDGEHYDGARSPRLGLIL